MRNWRWRNLESVLPRLREIADEREAQKRGLSSGRYWTEDGYTHLIGLVGEYVYGVESGHTPDYSLRASGDDGFDFPDVDVKCSTFVNDPLLKVSQAELEKGTRLFALVVYDVERGRAAYLGWASREQIGCSPQRDFGYGLRYVARWQELHYHEQLSFA